MKTSPSTLRAIGVAAAVAAALPTWSHAQVVITATIAPPEIPVYVQPVAPADGYLWTPGYWAYGPDGYYWVPGVWVRPPRIGVLWTPPYWGFVDGAYGFHAGYWGPRVGFYGGINYGFGYGGVGFGGGRWQGGAFAYNTAVSNVNVNVIHNTYVENVQNVTVGHTSFNGGNGGVQARPSPEEVRAAEQPHLPPTASQEQHFAAAQRERSQYASTNGGHPQNTAFATPRSDFGPGGDHAGEAHDAQRGANGGNPPMAQKQPRPNDGSHPAHHNADHDAAMAARQNRVASAEHHPAPHQEHHAERPHGSEERR